ncbi:MAG TPA: lipase maturation factor family protein [Candidatus Acidoferrales bacterium]|nr:lipase maturation factor family protein [Candidatus Acidoferrales bacterium]
MGGRIVDFFNWLLGPESGKTPGHLGPRWIFLRALGVIYFSAFYSLAYQVKGLVGPNGILPANNYLDAIRHSVSGVARLWYAPSVFWFSSTDRALMIVCWIGLIAAIALILNVWPQLSAGICFVCFLSFIGVLQDFSSYQSDGMLLEAGFLCLFFAPRGWLPRWGESSAPARACLGLLLWEWFRIYFESGIGKMLGGDPEWRHLTAMYEYYQNGPLPTWIGWYVQHAPHWFHWLAALATLVMEMGMVLLVFLPRRFRLICFFIVTLWEIGVILTANYAFLNYLVLSLGFLLLDDKFLLRIISVKWFPRYRAAVARLTAGGRQDTAGTKDFAPAAVISDEKTSGSILLRKTTFENMRTRLVAWRLRGGRIFKPVWMTSAGICFAWLFYATTAQLVWMPLQNLHLPEWPVEALEPFRIANQYGLFEVMTRARYEIEFQGSNDGGATWTAYPFQYKPQDVTRPPGIYAPYQPRFDWNLWFASLGTWRQYHFVVYTEESLLDGSPEVLSLFARNPFPNGPPQVIRCVIWQYWFTDMATKRETGDWWTRKLLGLYAPTLGREGNGRYRVLQEPVPFEPQDEQ